MLSSFLCVESADRDREGPLTKTTSSGYVGRNNTSIDELWDKDSLLCEA